MPRTQFNDGQEIVYGDLNAIMTRAMIDVLDRYLYESRARQQNFCFGDSFTCSYVNATTSQVKLGNGLYYDNTQVDPEPTTRLLYLAANTNVTHTAANGSFNRIDIICIAPALVTASTQSRNYKDPSSGVISSQSLVVETDWASTLQVVAGTPSGSPAVPSTPAGYIKLAEVLVTAVTGIGSGAAYTDKRPRFQRASSWKKVVAAITSATTGDLDDEYISANCNGGAFAYTLPLASLCAGKTIEFVKTDNSVNAFTVTAAGSDLINGSATQVISNQYTTMSIWCDGTSWYIK